MAQGKTHTAQVNKQVKWIKSVLGDRLTEADDLIITQAARQIVLAEELWKQVEKLGGQYIQPTSKGGEAAAPIYRMWQEAEAKVLAYSKVLGLNPVARKETLKTPPEQNTDLSDFEEAIQ